MSIVLPGVIRPDPDRLAALEAACRAWCGTPFCPGSAVRGAGVCCHLAVAEAYRDAGLLPRDAAVPTGPTDWSRHHHQSLMEPWLDGPGAAWFAAIPPDPALLQPGDLLGFRIGRCVHHLGILLAGGRLFHAAERVGAGIAPSIPTPWRARLARAWRPRALYTSSC